MTILISDECFASLKAEFGNDMDVPAQENTAVGLCCRAALMSYCEAREKGDADAQARFKCAKIYRLAMPPLIGEENIRDFIACVAHGMCLGLIKSPESTQLLYAAQVAHATRRIRSRKDKSRKSA